MSEKFARGNDVQALRIDELWPYRKAKGQALVEAAEYAATVLAETESDLNDFFGPLRKTNPAGGELMVARTLRDIALSSAMHIGMTEATARLLPALHAHACGPNRVEPFPLADHVRPLPISQVASFETEQSREFIRLLGGILMEWSEKALLDPASRATPLARAVNGLHKRFARAEIRLGIYQTTQDPVQFTLVQPAENAKLILGMLLSQALLSLNDTPSMDLLDIAFDALGQQYAVPDIASTNRSYFGSHVWRDAHVIRAYEQAVLSGGTSTLSVDASCLRYVGGEMRSPLPSLTHGPWRNPRMCIAFPQYVSSPNTSLYEHTTDAIYQILGTPDDAPVLRELVGQSHFSGIEMALKLGTLAAIPTIYQALPKVEKLAA